MAEYSKGKDCPFCYGYGYIPGENFPVTEDEAVEGMFTMPCENCGSDNSFYEAAAETQAMVEAEMQNTITGILSGGNAGVPLDTDMMATDVKLPAVIPAKTPIQASMDMLRSFKKLCVE
jgi:hypothetical protein